MNFGRHPTATFTPFLVPKAKNNVFIMLKIVVWPTRY